MTWKPIASVILVVTTLFTVVFVKMEVRRLGYSLLKLSREEKRLKDEKRELDIALVRMTRPSRIEQYATDKLELRRANSGQIVQVFTDPQGGQSVLSRIY